LKPKVEMFKTKGKNNKTIETKRSKRMTETIKTLNTNAGLNSE